MPSSGVPGPSAAVEGRKGELDFSKNHRHNAKRAFKRRIWRFYKSKKCLKRMKAPKAQEAWLGRKKPLRRDAKIGFKAYFKQLTSDTPPRNPTTLKGLSMTFATLNARGLNGDSGRTERQIIVKTMRRENMMSCCFLKLKSTPVVVKHMVFFLFQ